MIKSRLFAAVLALAVIAPVAASAGDMGKSDAKKNIVQTAREAGTFNTLLAALEATDLVGTLSGQGKGPFTVFAPTDAAFAKLPPGTVESLLADPAALKSILLYHVVPGQYLSGQVLGSTSLTTAGGMSLPVSKIAAAGISAVDIMARNGVIHVIDSVLLP